jgi:hypothetical protein
MINPRTSAYSPAMIIAIKQQIARPIIKKHFASTSSNMQSLALPMDYPFELPESSDVSLLGKFSTTPSNFTIKETKGLMQNAIQPESGSNITWNKYILPIVGGTLLIVALIIYVQSREKKRQDE